MYAAPTLSFLGPEVPCLLICVSDVLLTAKASLRLTGV